MSNLSALLFFLWAIAILTLVLFVLPTLDRNRIREHVESNGGHVVEILRDWFGGFGGRSARTYDVTYITRQGERITAKCITGMMSGVQWVTTRPPGSMSET
jgi:hypothetical protein